MSTVYRTAHGYLAGTTTRTDSNAESKSTASSSKHRSTTPSAATTRRDAEARRKREIIRQYEEDRCRAESTQAAVSAREEYRRRLTQGMRRDGEEGRRMTAQEAKADYLRRLTNGGKAPRF